MLIADLLRHKGPAGASTIASGRVGRRHCWRCWTSTTSAAYVVADGDAIVGIISERDVVRRLGR